jgi:hypothetical protein
MDIMDLVDDQRAFEWTRLYMLQGLELGVACKSLASIVESIAIIGLSLFVLVNLENWHFRRRNRLQSIVPLRKEHPAN